MKFKTNINCGGCIAAVTPVLDQAVGSGNWEVDTNHPLKMLTVNSGALSAEEISHRLAEIGYKATAVATA